MITGFSDLGIEAYPPNPDCVRLGQSKGYVIKWLKKYIQFAATSTQLRQPPATDVPPAGPSSVGISAPQTVEHDGGDEFPATSTQLCQQPATGVTPAGPSLCGISAPQTLEKDGGDGVGGDVVLYKEQLVGETLPPRTSLPQRPTRLPQQWNIGMQRQSWVGRPAPLRGRRGRI